MRDSHRILFPALLVTILFAVEVSADMPYLTGFHAGLGSASISNSHPRGLSSPAADASFLLPTFGTFAMDDESFWEWRVSPVYSDLVAALSYAPDELDEAFFSSGILGHFVRGRYLLNSGPIAIGPALS